MLLPNNSALFPANLVETRWNV